MSNRDPFRDDFSNLVAGLRASCSLIIQLCDGQSADLLFISDNLSHFSRFSPFFGVFLKLA